MGFSIRGRVTQGGVSLSEPLPFPEGAEVIVQVEPVHETEPANLKDFASRPFFGLWADRTDLPASEDRVQREA